MALRRALQQKIARLCFPAATESATWTQSRGYARVPAEYADSYAGKFPARRNPRPVNDSRAAAAEAAAAPAEAAPAGEAAAVGGGTPAAGTAAASAEPAFGTTASIVGETQRESARVATAFMFPWERRQMEGGKLKTWEKAYWGVFVLAMSAFLFNRLRDWGKKKEEPKVDEEKESRKLERARLVLAGGSVIEGAEDPFKGMTPQEIQEYVEKATGARRDDPFEGMTPEEINEYVAKNGIPAGMQ